MTTIKILALILFVASSATAHNLWLVPPEKAEAGKEAVILAAQGMDFPKSTGAPNAAAFKWSFAISPDGEATGLKVLPEDGKNAALGWTPKQVGLHIVAVETTQKKIEMKAAEFNAYLVSDGMPHVFMKRHAEKDLDRDAVEHYKKSVKTIVRVGGSNEGKFDKSTGLPLEIIPLVNPLTRKVGETLPVRVILSDQPLPDANLGWAYPGDGESPRGTVRTDAKGEALIPITKTGLMTIRLTHMQPQRNLWEDWYSNWTTLTFRIDP